MTPSSDRRSFCAALGMEFSDDQWRAISAPLTPGVIVAGAGTGKTTSMSARLAYLVASEQVDPNRVLGITFTNKAVHQFATAIERRLRNVGHLDFDPEITTYNAFAGHIVSEFGMHLGLEPQSQLLTDGSRHQHAYRFVCDIGADGSVGVDLAKLDVSPTKITGDMLRLDEALSNSALHPDQIFEYHMSLEKTLGNRAQRGAGFDLLEVSKKRVVLANLVKAWRVHKLTTDVWEYSDQVRLALSIVRQIPHTVGDIRSRYDIVMLDEYQDTSVSQRMLLQGIFSGGFPVTAVGDPCQAIYGWRGASSDNIENFPQHFPCQDGSPAPRYSLVDNRRSGVEILDVANSIALNIRAVHAGALPLSPSGDVKGSHVQVGMFTTIDDELRYVVDRIVDAYQRGAAAHQSGGESGSHLPSIGVLGSTVKDLRRVESALRERGVPTRMAGSAALLSHPAVADLVALLRIVHEPTANVAMVRLLSGARWRVGYRDLATVGSRAKDLASARVSKPENPNERPLHDVMSSAITNSDKVELVALADGVANPGDLERYSPAAVEAFAEITSVIDALRARSAEPVLDLAVRATRLLGLDVESRLADHDGSASAALEEFLTLAVALGGGDERMSLGGLLAALDDAEAFEITFDYSRPAVDGSVNLMTVFSSKGLEFDSVFVPFMSVGAFPGGRKSGNWTSNAAMIPWALREDKPLWLSKFPDGGDDSIAKQRKRYTDELRQIESRHQERLAYVAVTRAESALTVTAHWWGPDQKGLRGPHHCLAAMRTAIIEADSGSAEVVEWAPKPDDDQANPLIGDKEYPWPWTVEEGYVAQLHESAALVSASRHDREDCESVTDATMQGIQSTPRVRLWRDTLAVLHEELDVAVRGSHVVVLGRHVGASTFLRALRDPDGLAEELARPMPKRPSKSAGIGVAWHSWVETTFGQQALWGINDLPGAADDEIDGDEDLGRLKAAFLASRYAGREPVAVEQPFSLVVGGRVIRGRIDAVFADEGHFDVVDWKTGSAAGVNPDQLAIYRLAWSRLARVPWQQVQACFVLVTTGEELRPDTDEAVRRLEAWDQEVPPFDDGSPGTGTGLARSDFE